MVKSDEFEDIWSYMQRLETSIQFAADALRDGFIESAQLEHIDTRNAELAARYPKFHEGMKRTTAQIIDWPRSRVKNPEK